MPKQAMPQDTMVFLTYRNYPVTLSLKRVPRYLRFVWRGNPGCSKNWDALDQLDDVAEGFETIVAAEITQQGTVHVDRVVNRRRVGQWFASAEYTAIDPQPSDETMRNLELWRTWCVERNENRKADECSKT